MNSERRVRVPAGLYRRALDDAIDWTKSILETHDPTMQNPGYSCCKPGARCEQYRSNADRLRRYRRALAALDNPRTALRSGQDSTEEKQQ